MLSVGRKPAECSWDLCFTDSQKSVIIKCWPRCGGLH